MAPSFDVRRVTRAWLAAFIARAGESSLPVDGLCVSTVLCGTGDIDTNLYSFDHTDQPLTQPLPVAHTPPLSRLGSSKQLSVSQNGLRSARKQAKGARRFVQGDPLDCIHYDPSNNSYLRGCQVRTETGSTA